jgi:hypothetical protein
MRQIGQARKLFKELVNGDRLYYINPETPNLISEITVKEVRVAVDPQFVVVVYYKSDEATKLITDMTQFNPKLEVDNKIIKVDEIEQEIKQFNSNLIDAIPVGKLTVPKNATQCITLTMPPGVYYTNRRALEKFMGK